SAANTHTTSTWATRSAPRTIRRGMLVVRTTSSGRTQQERRVAMVDALERQEEEHVCRVERGIPGRLATDERAEPQVALQQRWQRCRRDVGARLARQRPSWEDAPVRRAQVLAEDAPTEGRRGPHVAAEPDARAADRELVPALDEVAQQAAPQERDDPAAAMVGADARPTDLDHAAAQAEQARQVELALGIEATGPGDALGRQHAVRPDDLAVGGVAHQEMIAERIEGVRVEARLRGLDACAELLDEHLPAKPLRGAHVVLRAGQRHYERRVGVGR